MCQNLICSWLAAPSVSNQRVTGFLPMHLASDSLEYCLNEHHDTTGASGIRPPEHFIIHKKGAQISSKLDLLMSANMRPQIQDLSRAPSADGSFHPYKISRFYSAFRILIHLLRCLPEVV